MGKKTKVGKDRLDKFYHLAKEQGYRSRAAFKLIQLNKKYDFLKSARVLLDLCAAPGGWLQIARKFMPVSSLVVGADLFPIRPIPNVVTLQADITTDKFRQMLKSTLNSWQVDVVLHDGAPNVGGAWAKDAYGQSELTLHSIKVASEFLRENGMFITKVFRSQDYNSLLWVVKQLFRNVEVMKPEASRQTSAEIYFVCKGFLAPKKIDSRMFDPSHVFKDLGVNSKKELSLNDIKKDHMKKRKGKAAGYDDSLPLFGRLPVKKFFQSETPVNILADHHELVFDEESTMYLEHPSTTEEIKELCKDIKVIGMREFKILLKWYKEMRTLMKQSLKKTSEPEEKSDAKEAEKDSDEEVDKQLQDQLDKMKKKEQSRLKRQRKKRRDMKMKSQAIAGTADVYEDLQEDVLQSQNGTNLFSLDQIKDMEQLDALQDEDENALPLESGDSEISGSDSELDSDEEEAARFKEMEDQMEALYKDFKDRKNIIDKKRREEAKKVGLVASDDEESGNDNENDVDVQNAVEEEAVPKKVKFGPVLDKKANPLEVHFQNEQERAEGMIEDWLDRDLLRGIDAAEDSGKDAGYETEDVDLAEEKDSEETADIQKSDKEVEPEIGLPSERTEKAKRKRKRAQMEGKKQREIAKEKAEGDAEEGIEKDEKFEEVPMDNFDEWSDDSSACAEALAMGTAMLRKKKRREMEESSYNRYSMNSFERGENLPSWFVEDEFENFRKLDIPEVTKEDVDKHKLRLMQINAKPIKKIAEALARKKMRAMKKWEVLKHKAEAISENKEISGKDKVQKIEKILGAGKRSLTKKKSQKVYVVSRKRGGAGMVRNDKNQGKGFVVRVDPRMKCDKRGMRAAMDRKNKSSKRR